ncbi:GNA1162 family protein [Thermaurantiacus sp.]
MRTLPATLLALLASACATAPPGKDYSAFRQANPRSILVVPVINHTNEVEAGSLFLTTLTVPLAERGYYVFPVTASRKLMEQSGLADPGLVHRSPTSKLASLFSADSVLYVEINKWEANYALFSSGITVGFVYTLKDGRSDALLWQDEKTVFIQTSRSTGNILGDLVAAAITAASDNARADYTPVANMANMQALTTPGQGLPFGPYSPKAVENAKLFPSSGSGRVSNASTPTLAWPEASLPSAGASSPVPKGTPSP